VNSRTLPSGLHFQGHVFPPIPYSRGGKQGGSETPFLWKRALDHVFKRVQLRWDEIGAGAHFDDQTISWQAWADDVVIFVETLTSLKSMLRIVSEELSVHGMNSKEGSIEALKCGGERFGTGFAWSFGEHSLSVRCSNLLSVLGVALDPWGSTSASIESRESAAWAHFSARSKVFTSSKLPLRARCARLKETVARTFLHGAGGWILTAENLRKIDVWENKILRATLNKQPRAGEDEQAFWRRLNSRVAFLKESLGWVSVGALAVQLHFGFWGHVPAMTKAQHWASFASGETMVGG
jgi:hypothetical protein